jgi:hypothetical protein
MHELSLLSDTPTREDMDRAQQALLAAERTHGVELRTRHHFAPGLYARELLIEAGTALAGARHKTRHLVEFVGDITVWHEGQRVRLTGRHLLVSEPGAQRIGFAHTDTWCTSFHPNPTDETDVRKLEDMLVEDAHLLQRNRQPALPTHDTQAIEVQP